jgi:hypothetical protein
MANMRPAPIPTDFQRSRQRSPNYPAIGLKAAIEKARLLYEADRKAGAPVDAALKHMGFSKRHGQAMAVLSALKKFDLVEEASGRIVPTQKAINILVFPDQDERKIRAIRECALSPEIYRELFEQYKPSGIPSEETLRAELIADKHFNPSAVEGFIRDFKETLTFAGIMNPVELSLQPEDAIEMNDLVQTVQPSGSPAKAMPQGMKEISLPIGVTEEGQAIFAHVRFDAPLKKGMLLSLKQLLDALEKTLT